MLPEHRAEKAAARETGLQRDLRDGQRSGLQQSRRAAKTLQTDVAGYADAECFDEPLGKLRVRQRRQRIELGCIDLRMQAVVDVLDDTCEPLCRLLDVRRLSRVVISQKVAGDDRQHVGQQPACRQLPMRFLLLQRAVQFLDERAKTWVRADSIAS